MSSRQEESVAINEEDSAFRNIWQGPKSLLMAAPGRLTLGDLFWQAEWLSLYNLYNLSLEALVTYASLTGCYRHLGCERPELAEPLVPMPPPPPDPAPNSGTLAPLAGPGWREGLAGAQ